MKHLPSRQTLQILAALAVAALAVFFGRRPSGDTGRVQITLGEIQAIHAQVTCAKRDVRGTTRFSSGDKLSTGPQGRARIRLDDGTTIVVDRESEITAKEKGLELVRGRLFVQGGQAARTEISAGPASTIVSASTLAFERSKGGKGPLRIYCALGEAQISGVGKPAQLRNGETAVVDGSSVKVAPEKAFNDWTGGMAVPWSATGRPQPAIGELWGRTSDKLAGAALLAVRLHSVQVRLQGEVATTHMETTYFNGGSKTVDGDFSVSLPPGGIVSRFAVRRAGQIDEGEVLIAKKGTWPAAKLEWAGPGLARGHVPSIPPGKTVTVIIDYNEWLEVADGRMAYRYPMVSDGPPPLLGEFHMRVDASRIRPTSIAVSNGTQVTGHRIEFRKADLRPEADFVVELGVPALSPGSARAYIAGPGGDRRKEDRFFLVRAELPPEAGSEGVTLAIVLDTSRSVSPSMLEASRGLIESILEGLGEHDRVALFTADQHILPLGEAGLKPVNAARRKAIGTLLGQLRPGGASDLGAALERAASVLPSDSSDAMLVYVGDGRPTLGDVDFTALRARLARRPSGIPRLGAIAVGPAANWSGLNTLIASNGTVLGLTDRSSAPEVAVALLTDALRPVVSGAELLLGPGIDRIYPRGPQVIRAQGILTVVGRARGELPTTVKLRYQRGSKITEKTLPVVVRPVAKHGDIRRRWAQYRVRDLIASGESSTIAAGIAQEARLLTPWTGFFFFVTRRGRTGPATPLADRVRDPAAIALLGADAARLSWSVGTGALLEPRPHRPDQDEDFEALIAAGARRTIDRALPGIRRCRAARAAARPELEGKLRIRVEIAGDGRASQVAVRARLASNDDPALNRCVASLISSLRFFDSGTTTRVTVEHEVELPRQPRLRARKCSPTSKMPLALRLAVWKQRRIQGRLVDTFEQSRLGCEIPRWHEQRALLDLLLKSQKGTAGALKFAAELESNGQADAAAHVRRVVIRRARTPEELAEVRRAFVRAEPQPGKAFAKQFKQAKSPAAQLAVVRRFLKLSPHDPTLLRALFRLLDAVGDKATLEQAIYEVRQDPFADAGLLADCASWLRHLGKKAEGLRALGELIERAPLDPFGRATAGDRMRDEGLFEEATNAYEVLTKMLPDDPAASMRLALAHAGAGRLDLATRVLQRVASTGGRTADDSLGELASITTAVLLAEAAGRTKGEEHERLSRRLSRLALPDASGVILIRAPGLRVPLEIEFSRSRGGADSVKSPPALSAPSLGLFAQRVAHGDDELLVRLTREPEIGPARPVEIQLDLVKFDEQRVFESVTHRVVKVQADGKPISVRWNEEEAK